MNVVVASPAKINPTLEILGRRADGLHEVSTTLLAIDRVDDVEVERVEGSSRGVWIELSGPSLSPDVPSDERNLACRGARVALDLARERGLETEVGIRLRIQKRIPSRAGLGGGSSNAASAALGAAQLLDLDPDDPEFVARVSALGADVAFFLVARDTGWAHCRGAGERVTPFAVPETSRAFVVLTPLAACATAAVYAALDAAERGGPPKRHDAETWQSAKLGVARASFFNGLEASALRSHPPLADFRRSLEACGAAHFRLAGSGSSFFGMYADEASARAFLEGDGISTIARDHGLRAAFVARPHALSAAP